MEKEDRGFIPGVVTVVHVATVRSLLPLLFCCCLVEITSLPSAEATRHVWQSTDLQGSLTE